MSRMNNDNTETISNELHASMREALKQNWENARYFESRRWNYIYYYYAALGSAIIYFGNTFKEYGFNFLQGDPPKFLFVFVVFLFLTLLGLGAFFQLAHANIEYKNFIRTNEFIAEELNLNEGFRKFRFSEKKGRKAYKDLPRTTKLKRCFKRFFLNKKSILSEHIKDGKAYMALPLGLGIRTTIFSAINLTALGAAFSGGVTIFYLFWFTRLMIGIELCYLYLYILIFAFMIFIGVFIRLCCWYKKMEGAAKYKLALRDRNPYTPNNEMDKDA